MACKPYNSWLTDAALGALPARTEAQLQRHLAVCSACRSALERERFLLAAIECGVAASVDAEPAPEMVARVRMRLAQENASATASFPVWLPVAGAVLAMFALFAHWLRPRVSSAPQAATETSSFLSQVAVPSGPPSEPFPPRKPSARPVARQPRQAAPREPQVLLPPGQWQAVLELADAVNCGRLNGQALAADLENSGKPLGLETMRLAPLEIARLDEGKELTEDNNQR